MASKQSSCAPPGVRSTTPLGDPDNDGSHVIWIRLRRGAHGLFESPKLGDVKPPEPVPKPMIRRMELFIANKQEKGKGEAA